MIVAAAVCPSAPLLLPGVTGRPVAEVVELRAACDAAIAVLLGAAPDVVAVVGAAPPGAYAPSRPLPTQRYAPMVTATAPRRPLPLGLAVGRHLLEAHGRADPELVAAPLSGPSPAGLGERVGLLVTGDGSARRGPKAPGYVDDRAAAFDDEVHGALGRGDPAALLRVDGRLAGELLAGGVAAWQVLAGAVGSAPVRAQVHYGGDPFGVWYSVVSWLVGTSRDEGAP